MNHYFDDTLFCPLENMRVLENDPDFHYLRDVKTYIGGHPKDLYTFNNLRWMVAFAKAVYTISYHFPSTHLKRETGLFMEDNQYMLKKEGGCYILKSGPGRKHQTFQEVAKGIVSGMSITLSCDSLHKRKLTINQIEALKTQLCIINSVKPNILFPE